MNSKTARSGPALIDRWKNEHQDLERFVREITSWMYDVSAIGVPRFGEVGSRLTELREQLVKHFQVESEIAAEFCATRPGCLERQAARRQALRDHAQLLSRIDDLKDKLSQPDPPFASWQEAVGQIGLFLDVLEQHEEQESENIQWLSP